MNERIAISGMGGFIGSHLAERFSSEQIERLDRTGDIPKGIDTVFDLAGYGNMAGHNGEPREIYTANLMRVLNSLEQLGESRFIYTSTSSVTLPVQTFYSLSKMAGEQAVQQYVTERGIRACIVRPLTVTGVGDQPNHLIPTLIRSCLYGEEMPFVAGPVHDFIDVNDFVDGMLTIADKGEFKGEVYEIGTGTQLSNLEIKLMVENISGKVANTRVVENVRKYDTKTWVADNRRLKALGWKPKKTIEQTISEMINYERTRSASN